MSEWKSPALLEEYAAKVTDPVTGWYEHEVNFPDMVRLIPSGAKTLLDFGCGPGEFTNKLSQSFPRVAGADIAPMLEFARENYSDIDFIEWDGENDIPDELETFDVVFSKLTLQFIRDIDALAAKFFEIVSQNGSVIYSIPNPQKIYKKFNLEPDTVTEYSDEIGDTGIKIYPVYRPERVYIEAFTKAGFKFIEISEPDIANELAEKYNVSAAYASQSHRSNFKFSK